MQQFDSVTIQAEARRLHTEAISAYLQRFGAWLKTKRLRRAAASRGKTALAR